MPSFQSDVKFCMLQSGITACNHANINFFVGNLLLPIWYLRIRCHIKPRINFKLPLTMSSGPEKESIIQSTLVISKSKGPSEIFRDIRTSIYQMCRTEENTNRTTKFHKWTCNLTPLVRNLCWKYCGKGEKLLLRSNFSSYPQYFVTRC